MFWSQLDPSLVRKIGSRPLVKRKRNCTSAGEMLQPWVGRWQEAQDRPLLPRDWKKAPRKLIGALFTLYVSNHPLRFGSGNRLGSDWPVAAAVIMAAPISTAIALSFICLLPARRILPQPMLADNGERLKIGLIQMNSYLLNHIGPVEPSDNRCRIVAVVFSVLLWFPTRSK
jgi:hypothetical protein